MIPLRPAHPTVRVVGVTEHNGVGRAGLGAGGGELAIAQGAVLQTRLGLRATDPLLPLIAAEFATTAAAASGTITAFVLSYGLLQVVYGPLGDRFGRVHTIAAASLVSALGSAACALAPGLDALVAARLVSGATIGALIPLARRSAGRAWQRALARAGA